MLQDNLPGVAKRFLRYVKVDTQADPDSNSVPSTPKQKNLGRLLTKELKTMGAQSIQMDKAGYVYATVPPVPSNNPANWPVVALLAHLDTSPEEPGANVRPVVHENYQGDVISLPGNPAVKLDPASDPALLEHIGHDIITSDGTTLLGSDDKAGVAIIMELAHQLLNSESPRPPLRLCFTVDEEIGKGVDHLDLELLGAEVAYTLDGSGRDKVYTETFNAASATLTVEGVVVHPGYAKDQLVNAVQILSEFIAALPGDERPSSTEGREGYFYPYRTQAADAHQAQLEILLRDFTKEGMQRRKDLVTQLVKTLELQYPRASFTLDIADQYENMHSYIKEHNPQVIEVAQQAAQKMGIDITLEAIRGGTDGARLSAMGLPTPNIFTGGHQFHSVREWNTVQNLERALAYTQTLVHCWAKE